MNGMSYSQFMNGLKKSGIKINRKMLSEMAIHDAAGFKALVETAKAARSRLGIQTGADTLSDTDKYEIGKPGRFCNPAEAAGFFNSFCFFPVRQPEVTVFDRRETYTVDVRRRRLDLSAGSRVRRPSKDLCAVESDRRGGMPMTIYAEYLFAENFIAGFGIIRLTAMLCGRLPGRGRTAAGAALCGFFSFIILLNLSGIMTLIYELIFILCVTEISFGPVGIRLQRRSERYYLREFSPGGIRVLRTDDERSGRYGEQRFFST